MRTSKAIILAPLILLLFASAPVAPKPSLGLPSLKLPFPSAVSSYSRPQPSKRRAGFFSDNPLISVKRSFQDIQSNVERSMQSLLAAGSAIGQRMLGMITRAPRLLSSGGGLNNQLRLPHLHSPIPQPPNQPPPAPVVFQQNHGEAFPNFDDCDCQFGAENEAPKFQPYVPLQNNNDNIHENDHSGIINEVSYEAPAQNIESYGSPAAPVQESYGSPLASPVTTEVDTYGPPQAPVISPSSDTYGTPLSPLVDNSHHHGEDNGLAATVDLTSEVDDNSLNGFDHSHDLSAEPVIHPGGSQDIDIHKVEILGAASVVQEASAKVPDQAHPEKYLNFDSDLLENVVAHNLWYKQTKKLKHHKPGEKLKVIPHLAAHGHHGHQ